MKRMPWIVGLAVAFFPVLRSRAAGQEAYPASACVKDDAFNAGASPADWIKCTTSQQPTVCVLRDNSINVNIPVPPVYASCYLYVEGGAIWRLPLAHWSSGSAIHSKCSSLIGQYVTDATATRRVRCRFGSAPPPLPSAGLTVTYSYNQIADCR
jgi:hypothetical protein